MWTQNINLQMQIQALELFSGQGKVSQILREAGVATVSYDVLYTSGNSMDFLTPSGFAFWAQLHACL